MTAMARRVVQAGLKLATVLVTAWASAGCIGVPPVAESPGRLTGTLTVVASTSLTEMAAELAKAFETAHPGLDVRVSFAADAELPRQAASGAPQASAASDAPTRPVDVVLSEGPPELAPGALAGAPVVFAGNQMVVAVAPGNPLGLANLPDLTRHGLRVALCAQTVPCGAASAAMLAAAGVALPSAARVSDVRTARALVERGKADAALVYRTDTRVAEDTVGTLEVAESTQGVISYYAATLASTPNGVAARAFVAYLASTAATARLTAAGFQPPP